MSRPLGRLVPAAHRVAMRTVAVLLAGLVFIGGVGFIPSPHTLVRWFGGTVTERFPCESRGCGCSSAVECWTFCGCSTRAEKLAWARREGVQPPAAARLTQAEIAWLASSAPARPAASTACGGSCCGPALRNAPVAGAVASCCGATASRSACGEGPASTSAAAGCCGEDQPAPLLAGGGSQRGCKGPSGTFSVLLVPAVSLRDLPLIPLDFSAPPPRIPSEDTLLRWHGRTLDIPTLPPKRTRA